jgi:DNA-directed RNA polymerase I subunit RPA1
MNPGSALNAVDTEQAVKHIRRTLKHPEKYEPTLAIYPPSRYLGSVSEKFNRELNEVSNVL